MIRLWFVNFASHLHAGVSPLSKLLPSRSVTSIIGDFLLISGVEIRSEAMLLAPVNREKLELVNEILLDRQFLDTQ